MDRGSGNHGSSWLLRMHTGISILRVSLLGIPLFSISVADLLRWCCCSPAVVGATQAPLSLESESEAGAGVVHFAATLAPDAKEWRNRIAQHQVALVGRDHHEHFSRATTSARGWLRKPDLILQCGEYQTGMVLRQLTSFSCHLEVIASHAP